MSEALGCFRKGTFYIKWEIADLRSEGGIDSDIRGERTGQPYES